MKPSSLTERLGWVPRRKGRGVIIWLRNSDDLKDISAMVAELAEAHPRVNFLAVTESEALDCLPGIRQSLAAPLASRPVLALFFARTRPQAIVLAEGAGGEALVRAARRYQIPVHLIGGEPDRLKRTLQNSILDAARKYTGFAARVLRLPGIGWLSARSLPQVADLPSLAEALGHPKRILCLGNGPSSESGEVRALRAAQFDAVFRVNHRWLERDLFVRPHMVFAAGSKPVRRIAPPCIFCLQDWQRAQKVRLASLLLGRGRSLVVAEDLAILDDWKQLESDGFGSFAPSNGSVMLSLARALNPRHITVAGVDLFSDPQGAYPGDARTANAYGIFHSREKEREFTQRWIRAASEQDGIDLRLIGQALNEARI